MLITWYYLSMTNHEGLDYVVILTVCLLAWHTRRHTNQLYVFLFTNLPYGFWYNHAKFHTMIYLGFRIIYYTPYKPHYQTLMINQPRKIHNDQNQCNPVFFYYQHYFIVQRENAKTRSEDYGIGPCLSGGVLDFGCV